MRTGPFSSEQVIERLNANFIPVYAINEEYREGGSAPPEEKQLYLDIYRRALNGGYSAGTVHVYVFDAEGQILGTRHVADAAKTDALITFLDEITARQGTSSGETVVAPRSQSRPPECEPGSLVLHLIARPIRGGGSWDGTAEDWITYDPEEVKSLLQTDQPGSAEWAPPADLAAKLLKHIYPVTENNDVSKNEILEQQFRIRRLADDGSISRARIDGRLVMRHDFYHKPDGKKVQTKLVGYIEWETATHEVRSFRLVTEGAQYGGGEFAVAVRSE